METLSNNSSDENKEYIFKYIIAGDSGVGKTCMIYYYLYNKVKQNSTQTIGVDYSSKTLIINNQKIKLQIWDTAGQDKFRSVSKSYYRGAIGIIIVYDITSKESFLHIKSWINEVKLSAREEASFIIIGNKNDLKDQREVSYEEAKKFSDDNNFIFLETSSITGENISEVFLKLSENILNKINNGSIDPDSLISNYAKELGKTILKTQEDNNGNSYSCSQYYC